MNITEANAVAHVIRQLAGTEPAERAQRDQAIASLGLLHDRMHRTLHAGPTGDELAAAQQHLEDFT